LGAWAKPAWSTPEGRATAFSEFAGQAGTQLPISHNFQEWNDEFPGAQEKALLGKSELLMISWSGTDTRSIVQGSYDANIRQRAEAIKKFGRKVLLRFRWEMDRPNLTASIHSPGDYVAAWKHVRQIFTQVGATNAGWVWCPHVRGFIEADRNAAAYYPGDDQVEWLCTDVYAGKDFEPFGTQMDSFLAFAQSHDKPIIIGEYGVTDAGTPGQRATWLREVRTYTKAHPQIKALVYFAAKQDRKPVYDSTFVNDPDGLGAFREMTSDPYFQAPPPPTGDK
jgi:beta-mannanase